MKKAIMVSTAALSALLLSGCVTGADGRTRAAGCDTGTNYVGAGLGALAGGAVGSLVGGGTGQVIATGAGAGIGAIAGSKTRVGC
jgi:hypothetical protein